MPATAIMSIGHRISGVILFISIPFFLYLFDLSLSGPDGFIEARRILDTFVVKFFSVILLWGLIHHFLAGIRFLLIDIHIGMGKGPANKGAWLVHVSELVILFFVVLVIL